MNIFCGYMCSKKFEYQQNDFQKVVQNFDYIFRDINTGHVMDFLPSLEPLFPGYINEIKQTAVEIREYILDNICLEKYGKLKQNPSKVEDLVDACFSNLLVSGICPLHVCFCVSFSLVLLRICRWGAVLWMSFFF